MSEWKKRLVQIFWPSTTHEPSSCCTARVRMASVFEPASGSVTPKAWRRMSPEAMPGKYCCFCSSEPWRRTVPMMYIWAWQAPALQPWWLISSRMIAASDSLRPPPPYCSGISAPSQPSSDRRRTNSVG